MVPANEIRIGNFFYIRESEHAQQVKNIFEDKVLLYGYDKHYNIEQIRPLPISPVFLAQFGFIRSDRRDFDVEWGIIFNGGDLIIIHEKTLNVSLFSKNDLRGAGLQLEHVKYFHQLQNLYFSISGEDLRFKRSIDKLTPDPPTMP